jgi:hypothetical protein
MQGYIRLTATLLRLLNLPAQPVPSKSAGGVDTRLLDWLVGALVNIRREERFFMEVAERYGVGVDLTRDGKGSRVVREESKIEGLKRFEKLFSRLTSADFEEEVSGKSMPWLEGAVVFWATERVYFEAWSWAKEQAGLAGEGGGDVDTSKDQDGGAMRKEFIPNWTNDEFKVFVKDLESILNDAVEETCGDDERVRKEVHERAEGVWKELLECEVAFWPEVKESGS